MPAPIALFAYKRLDTLKAAVYSLLRNPLAKESELYVFADGPKKGAPADDVKKIAEVRAYLETIRGFSRVIVRKSPVNKGLAASIIAGVTSILQESPSVIVVEDDLVLSRSFLEYMNEALELYENDPEVASIHGYVPWSEAELPETFFIKGADCWGWATWRDAWAVFEPDARKLLEEIARQGREHEFDIEGACDYTAMLAGQAAGIMDSWAIRWYASAFLRDMLTLYPGKSLVRNIGLGNHATHTLESGNLKQTPLTAQKPLLEKLPLREDPAIRSLYRKALCAADKRNTLLA